jgi:hypothetical protein
MSILGNSTLLYGVDYAACDLLPHGKFAEVLPEMSLEFDLRLSRSVFSCRILGSRATALHYLKIRTFPIFGLPHEGMMDV